VAKGTKKPERIDRSRPAGAHLAVSFMAVYPDFDRVKAALAEHGYEASEACLLSLKYTHAKELAKAQEDLGGLQEHLLKSQHRSNGLQAAEAVQWTVERVRGYVETHKDADVARIARDLQQISTQATDKYSLLDGKPTKRTQLSMPQFYELQKQGIEEGWLVDETAEITDAETLEDATSTSPSDGVA
jgi:hypothetical protein